MIAFVKPDNSPKAQPRQFRLRSLLFAVVFVAIPCAWYAWAIQENRHETIVAANLADFNFAFAWRSIGPTWFPKLKAFERVDEVSSPPEGLGGKEITNSQLKVLRELSHLRTLRLDRTKISDDGLLELERLSGLKTLDLSQTKITDAGLQVLLGFTELESLSLNFTGRDFGGQITDDGIVKLAALPNLRTLCLFGTDASNKTLKALASSHSLQFVDLRESAAGSEEIEDLRRAHPTWTVLSD